jgi:hypothetical protein
MAWLQNPIFIVVILIILVGLLVAYRAMRASKKQITPKLPQTGQSKDLPPIVSPAAPDAGPVLEVFKPMVDLSTGQSSDEIGEPELADDRMDQIINPDINLLPDVLLKPGGETVLLILPEPVPIEEVKKFEEFLKDVDSLKIVTTGGSSEEGSNIGIQVLKPVNLNEILGKSNMSIVKHLRKKGERIVLTLKV